MKSLVILISTLIIIAMSTLNAQTVDTYYFSKIVNLPFEEASDKVKASLAEQQFGIVTEVDMHEKFIEKGIDANAKPYRLLGACNPKLAYETVNAEENIGLFLPCKVIVKYIDENTTEIVMIDPSKVMSMLGNEALNKPAEIVTKHFKEALENL